MAGTRSTSAPSSVRLQERLDRRDQHLLASHTTALRQRDDDPFNIRHPQRVQRGRADRREEPPDRLSVEHDRAWREAPMALEELQIREEIGRRGGRRGHDGRDADVSKIGQEVPSARATRGFEGRPAVSGCRPTRGSDPTRMGPPPRRKWLDVLLADRRREDVVLSEVLAEDGDAPHVVADGTDGETVCPQVLKVPIDVRADRRLKIAPAPPLGRNEFLQHRHPPCRHSDGEAC